MTIEDLLAGLAGELAANPKAAATLRRDLHAILLGQPTIGDYPARRRAIIRLALGPITVEELTELIGPAD